MQSAEKLEDIDSLETQEWLDALESVLETEGPERAHFLINKLIAKARRSGAYLPYSLNTAYINTIPTAREEKSPGNPALENRIRSIIRWNATVMVLRANKKTTEYGGHIASFASSATLYDVGFNHFWRAPTDDFGGDLIYIQGHSAPGIYARAFLEGRLDEEQMDNFRSEVDGNGLSSYPHPWLMPDFWQFPTVSMGLGPIMAIYQARFLHYLENREIMPDQQRKVWAFMGDGEMDEPESMGAIGLAGREQLDNLVFVINCNLQRLDGPVRGNGKIIQELESSFRGAGWNVIKVIWGGYWDPLLAHDTNGLLVKRMEEALDGEYQTFKARGGAYTREHFFGKYAQLKEMVANMTDHDIWRLNRGGHDPHKLYAAYTEAMNHSGQPTVILAKTVKGYGMGESGEAQNITHQQKKMDVEALKRFRDRFSIPVADDDIADLPYYRPDEDSDEISYLKERRAALGGYIPTRRRRAESIDIPPLEMFETQLESTGDREISTTMAFVRILSTLVRNKEFGKYVVPIIPDEARTFGMEGLFRQLGIYSSLGQLYEPEDSEQLMYYREDKKGQVIQEGINEAGAMSSWIAASTSYSTNNRAMIPFYIYYSMFGFQRVGDLAWAAGDMQARGFLIGGTAGRTTLAGEGLQHQDGHSHLLASTIPNCISYDPTYAYELAVIIHDGLKRMMQNQENVFFYISVMNENYSHPKMPEGSQKGILKGMYRLRPPIQSSTRPCVQLLGSGTILREAEAAAMILNEEFAIAADLWSVTSYNELAREGRAAKRRNRLNPDTEPVLSYVEQCLTDAPGPVISTTDYVTAYADQIREFVPGNYTVLGTDGFGRSDTRKKLRHHFEVDRHHICIAALEALANEQVIEQSVVLDAIKKFDIDPDKIDPIKA